MFSFLLYIYYTMGCCVCQEVFEKLSVVSNNPTEINRIELPYFDCVTFPFDDYIITYFF